MVLQSPVSAAAKEPATEPHPLADQVVIVANERNAHSQEIAAYYARARGISTDRIILLDVPDRETISRGAYNQYIHNPLLRILDERGLMEVRFDAAPEDPEARQGYTLIANHLRYLVLCYGMPLRVSGVAELDESAAIDHYLLQVQRDRPDLARRELFEGRFAVNQGSVDGELAALPMGPVPVTGLIGNPLFRRTTASAAESSVLRVTRLDGPTPGDARRLVDSALKGERAGPVGRVYIDQDGRGEGYKLGNDWLAAAGGYFKNLGYEVSTDLEEPILDLRQRIDAPFIYLGWYSNDVGGVFNLPDFDFPPGAIAAHIHSFSARTVRDSTKGWVGPLVARGVTGTVGNVYEPYLFFSHHLDALTAGLLEGWTWGEAAYFSLPGLSWQQVVMGDPLYRPFGEGGVLKTLAQTDVRSLDGSLKPYGLILSANLLRRAGKGGQARELLQAAVLEQPHPVLVAAVLDQFTTEGDADTRRGALKQFADSGRLPSSPMEWSLYADLAAQCARERMYAEATSLYRLILERPEMEDAYARFILSEASLSAAGAGQTELSATWRDHYLAIRRAEEAARQAEEAKEAADNSKTSGR